MTIGAGFFSAPGTPGEGWGGGFSSSNQVELKVGCIAANLQSYFRSRLKVVIPVPDLSIAVYSTSLPVLRDGDVFLDFGRQLVEIHRADAP